MPLRLLCAAALSACLAFFSPARAGASAAPAEAADPRAFEVLRESFLALARESYLDKAGRTPLPAADFAAPDSSAAALSDLKSLEAQAAFIQSGRGPQSPAAYADQVVVVAERLGIDPPESALPVYAGRTRSAGQPLTTREEEGAVLLAAAPRPTKRRYLYLDDLTGLAAVAIAPRAGERLADAVASTVSRGAKNKRKKRSAAVAPPPEPAPSLESVLDDIDWDRAEALASAAEEGASGWYKTASSRKVRREQRRRRGRCYEWVRMALQETGLWTDGYRDAVTGRGDWRRPRRAYSFAWAMNALETKEQSDPEAEARSPLRRLDLRVDPLVIGSILVFDRKVCGFNAKSGHIEVISSLEPLRASSYKFHEVKLPCLIQACAAGHVHVYVPRLQDEETGG